MNCNWTPCFDLIAFRLLWYTFLMVHPTAKDSPDEGLLSDWNVIATRTARILVGLSCRFFSELDPLAHIFPVIVCKCQHSRVKEMADPAVPASTLSRFPDPATTTTPEPGSCWFCRFRCRPTDATDTEDKRMDRKLFASLAATKYQQAFCLFSQQKRHRQTSRDPDTHSLSHAIRVERVWLGGGGGAISGFFKCMLF